MKLANVVGPYTLEFADAGDGIFMCLAQYALKDEEYRTYYRDKAAQGDEVILDNGAAEDGAMPLDHLLAFVEEIKPTVWVVPDYVRDAPRTLWSLVQLQDELSSQVPVPYMVAPQGSDVEEWIVCFEEMAMRIPSFSWVGVSKFLDQPKLQETRWGVLNEVADVGTSPYDMVWHLLGVSSVESLVECAGDFPWLHSVDTSLAIAAGLQGVPITLGMDKIEMDFTHWGASTVSRQLILDNIHTLRRLVHGETPTR